MNSIPITGINSPPVPLTREALLDAIASASLDAVIAIDHDGQIIRWNPVAEKVFGWTEAEAVGLTIHETIIPERDRPGHISGLASYKARGRSNIFGSRFRRTAVRANGDEIPVELSLMCIESISGDLLVSFIRDLSEEERAKKALEELQMRLVHVSRTSAMATMATTLAHELNQPLAAASNYLSATSLLVERGDPTSLAEAKTGLTRSLTAIKRAAETIKSVRAMVDKKPLRLRPYRLRPLIEDAIQLLGTNLRVKPKIDIPPEAEWVLTSKVQIEQVIINLLRNASDATHSIASPTISLSATKGAEDIEITVADNGAGIPSDRMEILFTPFNSTKPDGLGMGLSICRTLVEQNEGYMWAISEPGRTEFHFTVPLGSKA